MNKMKLIKNCFILVVLMLSTSVYAVTLPSQSYTPSSYDSYSSGTSVGESIYGVSLPGKSFVVLGAADGDGWGTKCEQQSSKDINTCITCCQNYQDSCEDNCPDGDLSCIADCESKQKNCADYCGRTVPLGSGLCMVLMALVYGSISTISVFKRKNA